MRFVGAASLGTGDRSDRLAVFSVWILAIFFAVPSEAKLFSSFKAGSAQKAPALQSNRLALLNYPELPKEIADVIHTGKDVRQSRPASFFQFVTANWGLVRAGFTEALHASTEQCASKVVIAVIDTGIDYTHPRLRNTLWVNKGESGPWTPPAGVVTACRDKGCNGIDDDGNGFVDDTSGWDFVHNVPRPFDGHGHGTHIAGLAAMSPCVQIMPLKYYDNSAYGYNNLQNTVRAIDYAIAMGAHIINYSGGGSDPATDEREAVGKAYKAGILFVAAAGNDAHDNDVQRYYPASYPYDNIISVASLTPEDMLLSSSNWGKNMVHIGAPGLSIPSTVPNGRFDVMSGTSQATAIVTGAAAVLATRLPSLNAFDYKQIKHWIVASSKPWRDTTKPVQSGILSLPSALKLQREELRDVPPSYVPEIAFKAGKKSASRR